jgi:hypothetical protein
MLIIPFSWGSQLGGHLHAINSIWHTLIAQLIFLLILTHFLPSIPCAVRTTRLTQQDDIDFTLVEKSMKCLEIIKKLALIGSKVTAKERNNMVNGMVGKVWSQFYLLVTTLP